jgi:hypothetical protein
MMANPIDGWTSATEVYSTTHPPASEVGFATPLGIAKTDSALRRQWHGRWLYAVLRIMDEYVH